MKSALLSFGLVVSLATACGGKLPETRYYQLAAPQTTVKGGELLIVLDALETDAAYDDERIVYRTTPYRLDYYQYHRWSASPGVMVGNFLEQALERSGKFRAVVRQPTDDAGVVLTGRVVAIEEVDSSKQAWVGRIVIELALSDARTHAPLWTQQFEETEPLAVQTPEGLAEALSRALTRISTQAAPTIAEHAERQARLHAEAVANKTPLKPD